MELNKLNELAYLFKELAISKGVIIAGTHSGVGKTTLALGLMAALRQRGLRVAPFKVGPDFIDPGHHTHVTGRTSRNLDGWMLSKPYNQTNFQHHAAGCDVAVVEGVMGLFDGSSGQSEDGSTAQMAKWLNLPVLLVVDAASMARSAAALVQGFERFDPQISYAGVVFNNVGSKGHLAYLKEAVAAHVDMPLVGGQLRNDDLRMPERHLGLTTAQDRPLTEAQVNFLADQIESSLDLDGLLERLPRIQVATQAQAVPITSTKPRIRLGVARDRAFCFYYPENLELLAAAGAQLVPFSPLENDQPPEDIDGMYFGGGYPELYAEHLAKNRKMREAIRCHSHQGMPIYAECGGFMYLCRELEVDGGKVYPMCNCFPFRSRMQTKLTALGYREVRLDADTLLGGKGQTLRGHEFHYSDLADTNAVRRASTVYSVSRNKGNASGSEGHVVHRTLGSYIHLHFGSRPECAKAFTDTIFLSKHEVDHTERAR